MQVRSRSALDEMQKHRSKVENMFMFLIGQFHSSLSCKFDPRNRSSSTFTPYLQSLETEWFHISYTSNIVSKGLWILAKNKATSALTYSDPKMVSPISIVIVNRKTDCLVDFVLKMLHGCLDLSKRLQKSSLIQSSAEWVKSVDRWS